eukprot:11845319-Alexandrium_andersonii.AAC.1
MTELLNRPEVENSIGHMCRFGMQVLWPASAGGGGRLVRKPTRWATSSPEVLKHVCLRCTSEGLALGDER